jgi:hypothetical protein
MSDAPLRNLLLDALSQPRCPVCTVLDSMVFDELCCLQREAVVDPDTHADVLARGGYCADHFWYLDGLASPVTNAQLLAPLIDRLAERLAALAGELAANPSLLRQGAAQLAARIGMPASCRVCESVGVWQAAAIAAMLDIIADSGLSHYGHGGGLCLPHLAQALSACKDSALADSLVRAAVEQSRRFGGDLREYVRKWKAKDRGWGPEDAAPRCSIEKLVGAKRQRGSN